MKKIFALTLIGGGLATMVACHKNISAPTGTTTLELPSATPQYYGTMTTSMNPRINDKAMLGRVLFYDGHLSLNNAISCGSCHKQVAGFADNVRFSTGFEGKLTGRNSQAIVNIGSADTVMTFDFVNNVNTLLFWDARETNVKHLVGRPITNHVEMGMDDMEKLPAKLSLLPFYADLFTKAYGDNNITADRISESIAAFLMSIKSNQTRFDKYLAGDITALNALEQRGFALFRNTYNCESCHQTVTNAYTSTGVVDIGLDEDYTDIGNGAVTGNKFTEGMFTVPSLRNVALTGPYMHDGRFKTLDEVIDHYSKGIKNSVNLDARLRGTDNKAHPMNITPEDKSALVAFLNTMTDYQMISDPKFANPFKTK